MTDTFRESLTNNWNIVGTLPPATTTTDSSIHWLAQHPTRRRSDQMKHHEQTHQHHQTTDASTRRARQATAPVLVGKPAHHKQRYHNSSRAAPICLRSRSTMSTKERTSPYLRPLRATAPVPMILWFALASCLLLGPLALADDSAQKQQAADPRSTQPTLDRQLESPSPSSSSTSSNSAPVKPQQQPSSPSSPTSDSSRQQNETPAARPSSVAPAPKPQKLAATLASQKRAAAIAAQRDYDKYQLKASSSSSPARVAAQAADSASVAAAADLQKQTDKEKDKDKEKEKANNSNGNNNGHGNNNKQEASSFSSSSSASSSVEPAHKKVGQLPNTRPHPKASAFSLLRKFLPSFMTSAAAAAAAASASAVADKQPHQNQHSRSSATSSSLLSSLLSASSSSAVSSSSGAGQQQQQSSSSAASSGSGAAGAESSGSPLTGKIINLLTGAQKKKGLPEGVSAAIPNHAPFFMRKSATDRQAGGGALALASGLLSNPLKLGLLFSAPLLPSLLLTPLAIAGLSPAMSAINNFFGDDDEPSAPSSSPSVSSSQSPLSALAGGSSSPWASILQATGASPSSSSSASGSGIFSSSDSSSSSSGGSGSALSGGNSLALQALQSFVLGPTSTTERPLFRPGMFASSGIQNAAGAISSAISAAGQQSSSSSGSNNNNQRPFFGSGGGLMQAAASMISPSFAAPPSSSSLSGSNSNSNSNNDEDDRGLIQMASDVFEKVANYMGNDNTKDGQSIAQASGGPANSSPALSALASLSSMSPFQLSSLFPSSLGQASSSQNAGGGSSAASSSSPVGNKNQRVGFFSTLRNVYELFSSSFLRRQEIGSENECQQRLVCELHQRAMNSKMFRRSLQTSLAELANLDKNLLEQIKYGTQAIQARVDPDTKAMLNDFLKATNNFKSGREMINCSQMFPKCTRTQLLAAANAHLADPVNGRAIGKFSQLMKKMKFKANQQSTNQWKLRKPGKSSAGNQATRPGATQLPAQVSQPMDHMQVVPLQSQPISGAANGQFTPADSLKLAQQIILLSQMSQQQPTQQQQQQQQPQPQWSSPAMTPVNYPQSIPPMMQQQQQPQLQQQLQQQQQAPSYSAGSFSSTPVQYSPAPKQQTTYTDAMVPTVYSSPTDSPYFMPAGVASQQQQQQQQQQQPQQYMNSGPFVEANQPQVVQPVAVNQQQSSNGNNQQGSSYQAADQSMPQQQQPSRGLNMDNKNKPQQLLASNNKMAAIAA